MRIVLDGRSLTLEQVALAAAGGARIEIAQAARALMILRANVLAGGYSGIRESTLDLLVSLIERDVLPIIPEKGSVGASGDLAPLAHLALVLIGEGEAVFRGARLPGREALSR